ncbi:anchored repeat-type ABC transporter permease subunit [Glycomyces sp. NRRL B-16210]|uniref:anchored repeat-type ABC transporter permease subunit n=1 Tax=Glycomyces sp. NRRL B-16210 TaxID=1463821 RepID=UPI0004BED83E|nr:anchored repeat-type ABC transporter permease subunit [Glycomyces sp. NRRL B-16210]
MIEWLAEPWSHVFMQRAFAVAVMSAVVCVAVGAFVVLRGMAFIGDAVAHAVFPGVAIGFVLHLNLALSGAVAGVATALAIVLISQTRRLKEDTVIGIFWAAAFGLGIVVVSTQDSYTGDLASFLFGQILALGDEDVVLVAVAGAVLVAATFLLRRQLIAVSLDRETARASGLPVLALDIALYVMVTVAIVIALQAVGNILVLALLVTPAAAARLVTDRLGPMVAVGCAVAAFGAIAGLYLSFYYDLAAGGLIVLVITGVFLTAWLFAPRHGVLAKWRTRRIAPVERAEA